MALIIIYLVTLLSSAALAFWSAYLLKHFEEKNSKMIEGRKSLYVYLVLSIFGVVLSTILLIGIFI